VFIDGASRQQPGIANGYIPADPAPLSPEPGAFAASAHAGAFTQVSLSLNPGYQQLFFVAGGDRHRCSTLIATLRVGGDAGAREGHRHAGALADDPSCRPGRSLMGPKILPSVCC